MPRMEDVTFPLSNAFFLTSIALDYFVTKSRKAKVVSVLLSLVACAVLFTRIQLPIGDGTVDAVWLAIASGWIIVLAVAVPRALRAAKAHARE